jgi:hypothetical protein
MESTRPKLPPLWNQLFPKVMTPNSTEYWPRCFIEHLTFPIFQGFRILRCRSLFGGTVGSGEEQCHSSSTTLRSLYC